MSADPLIARLDKVRRAGPGRWMARCAAHKDRSASLSVRELDDGRTLVHCFAGCEVEAVLAAVGLELDVLFPPRDPAQPARKRDPRPFTYREALEAFRHELHIAWLVLADVAQGKELKPADRARAGQARERCMALLQELTDGR